MYFCIVQFVYRSLRLRITLKSDNQIMYIESIYAFIFRQIYFSRWLMVLIFMVFLVLLLKILFPSLNINGYLNCRKSSKNQHPKLPLIYILLAQFFNQPQTK
jgi:hypothetical protein